MIGLLIHKQLSEFLPLVEIIEDRSYPLIAPEGVDVPYVVYSVSYLEPDYVKTNVFSNKSVVDNIIVTINVTELTYVGLQTLVSRVREALEGVLLTYNSITTKPVRLYSTTEGFNNKARTFITKIEFNIITNRILI